MNCFGLSSSHSFQLRAVKAISKDAVDVARLVARDPKKIKLMEYDNFNWMSRAWEVSAIHGNIQHDQVSAVLVVLDHPTGPDAPSAEHLRWNSRRIRKKYWMKYMKAF